MDIAKFINFCLDIFLPKKTSKAMRQFFSYLVCGGVATVADSAVLFTLTHIFGVNYLVAAAFGFLTGVATNYTLNVMLVFQSQGKIKKELSLFVIIGLGGLAWTEIIIWVLVDKLRLYLMIAKMIAVILVLFWNFFMRKKFVFPTQSNLETLEQSIQEL